MAKDIYQYFGMEFSEKTEQNIKEHLGYGSMQKKHGSTKNTSNDNFLYTEEQVRNELKFYTDRFPDMF